MFLLLLVEVEVEIVVVSVVVLLPLYGIHYKRGDKTRERPSYTQMQNTWLENING